MNQEVNKLESRHTDALVLLVLLILLADMKFVKKFTRPNFRAKEFYTRETRKSQISVMWSFFNIELNV